LFGGYVFVKGYPYRLYSNWIQGTGWNKYYQIEGYRSQWLKPIPAEPIDPYKEDYGQLWKEFPLTNIRIPLPVRHPLYVTVPFLKSENPKSKPLVGMILLNPAGREQSRIYTIPVNILQDHTQGQELFKLPFVKNRILKLPTDKLWQDIFKYEISVKSKSIDEMIYDLYILHLRSKILPKSTIKYSLLKDDKALVELVSDDKDYRVELVMTNNNGSVYSYILRTEINNDESLKLRSKFLESITFIPIDPALGKFLYTEFKQLNFARQVDQEGMLYLFAAWTQDFTNIDMFKEMIFYLERGRGNSSQLRELYGFAVKRFGKTFTTKSLFSETDDQDIALQRRIEIEKIDKDHEVQKEKSKLPVQPDLTPDEKMNEYLKKAKEEGDQKSDDMIIN
jgi:hypothetical protein